MRFNVTFISVFKRVVCYSIFYNIFLKSHSIWLVLYVPYFTYTSYFQTEDSIMCKYNLFKGKCIVKCNKTKQICCQYIAETSVLKHSLKRSLANHLHNVGVVYFVWSHMPRQKKVNKCSFPISIGIAP